MLPGLLALLFFQNVVDVKPSPQQLAWQDLEIGVLIHFGPNTFQSVEWGDGTADPKVFNPSQFNPEQWVLASKAAGAKYLILVAKHHDGFCLWPSRATKYGVASSPWKEGKGDAVKEVAEACRKHGLKFGLYLSPWDRHEPAYKDNTAYDNYYTRQLVELATRYGPLTEFWLDGAGSEGHVYDFQRYIRNLRTYQPNSLIFASLDLLPYADIRWVGNEDGSAQEENWNVIDGYQVLRWRPAEADTPLRHRHWFWHKDDEKSLKSLDELMDTYHKTVGRGAQLVLGLAPDDRGLMPDVDAARLKQFGDEVARIYERGQLKPVNPDNGSDNNPETWWSPVAGASGTISLRFAQPVTIDRSMTSEWLAQGQRVRRYQVRALVGNQWTTVARGTTVGHKKIDLFPAVTTTEVGLWVEAALDTPRIAEFQVYFGHR